MRILLHDYGGYAFTLQLAGVLSRRGHQVCYVYSETTQFVKRCDASRVDEGVLVNGICLSRPFEKYSFLQRRGAEIEHGRLVASEIASFHPDAVISANTPLDAQAKILSASNKVNAKFIYWFQDAIGMATRRALHTRIGLVGDLIGVYYQVLERSFARASGHLVVISEEFSGLMEAWGIEDEKTSVIPNWAPLADISVQQKNNTWAVKNDLADKFCFLYTGILGLKHNPELFVQLAQHFKNDDDVRVAVISEGGGMEWLKDQKKDLDLNSLVLLPFQPADVYEKVLGSADVLVLILKEDAGKYSVPSKVLSYFCAARPILLSVPLENAAARMVLGSQAGLVSSPNDCAGFLQNARLLYGDQDLRSTMGQSGRCFAEKEFDVDSIADKFEAML